MLEVVETIIGEISLNDCVTSSDFCRASATCAVNKVWIKARNQLRQTLADVSFKTLLKEESCFMIPQMLDKNTDIDR